MRDRLRHALLIAAAVSGFAIFGAFAVYEEPGLGLGHFFYVPIILAALATGPAISAGAAVIATAMYASGVIINSDVSPSEVFTTSTGIRFVTFVTVGIVTGYFAKRNRTLLAELRLLADRDALTGLPNTRVSSARSANGSFTSGPSGSSSAVSTSSRRGSTPTMCPCRWLRGCCIRCRPATRSCASETTRLQC
jgi:K+-sensing histidine kinase KdpD